MAGETFICCDHPRTQENTITRRTRDGYLSRTCRTCRNDDQRKRYAQMKLNYEMDRMARSA